MTHIAGNRILSVTRGLVYLIMGLVAVVAAGMLLGLVLLPIYWTDIVAELSVHKPGVDLVALLLPLLFIFALGAVTIGLIWTIMRKLLAIIASVEIGEPFVHANVVRLKAIGWMMVAIQLVGFPLAIAAKTAADMFGANDVDVDVSLNGILAILLVFILAGIFERGAEMRDELEGTV